MIRPGAIALLLPLLPLSPARAEEQSRPLFTARVRVWFLHGTQSSRFGNIDPNFTTSGGGPVWTGSTIDTRLKGAIPVAEVEAAPLRRLSVHAEYGTAGVSAPNSGISSWVDAPREDLVTNNNTGATWSHPGHDEYIHASAGGDAAKTSWAQANVCLRLVEGRAEDASRPQDEYSLDALLGVERFEDHFTLQDALVDVNTGQVPNFFPLGARLPGAFYNITSLWRGPHVGARAETRLPGDLRLDTLVLWSPLMEYRGDTDDFVNAGAGARAEFPNITERAHGTAIHFRLGAQWRWRGLSLDAGWQRLYFYSRTGVRRVYNGNGTVFDSQLDHAITERAGFFTGASYRF